MKKIIIIIVAVLVVAGAAAYLFLIPKPPEPPKKSAYVPGDYFVTNVRDSKMLLKTTIVLEVDKDLEDEEFQNFLAENSHIIRDTIVFILRNKTEEELRAADVKEKLISEMVPKINEKLGIDNVKTLYFNDYVLQ